MKVILLVLFLSSPIVYALGNLHSTLMGVVAFAAYGFGWAVATLVYSISNTARAQCAANDDLVADEELLRRTKVAVNDMGQDLVSNVKKITRNLEIKSNG